MNMELENEALKGTIDDLYEDVDDDHKAEIDDVKQIFDKTPMEPNELEELEWTT